MAGRALTSGHTEIVKLLLYKPFDRLASIPVIEGPLDLLKWLVAEGNCSLDSVEVAVKNAHFDVIQ